MLTRFFSLTIAALAIGLSQTAVGSIMTNPNNLTYTEQSGPFRTNVSVLAESLPQKV
jgi:hypothetical protein